MLRAVLVGLLTLSSVSCKSHGESQAKSQSGVAAGKVVEVTGSVTLHHGTETRPLAKGDMVDADDEVETAADASVLIEVQHNNVTWDLGPGKKGKLRESLAWTQPKKDKSAKAGEEDSTAAGRHAERSAAESSVTASAPPAPEAERADKAPAAAPMAPPVVQPAAPSPKVEEKKKAAPPPPPPPPPPKAIAKSARATSDSAPRLDDVTVGALDTRAPETRTSPTDVALSLVSTKRADLAKCLVEPENTATLVVTVDATGQATIEFHSKLAPATQSCFKKVINGLTFEKTATDKFTVKITKA